MGDAQGEDGATCEVWSVFAVRVVKISHQRECEAASGACRTLDLP